ncbi:MAG TPA: MFS transporter [Candidatus Sulfotelmatobacter sp.]|jgi:FSR family fosmidomycin resistance protein-like MFS transporter|nr:MFS transporter [Candidatus Sulfotelmatobacter sp.]
MSQIQTAEPLVENRPLAHSTVLTVLCAISFSHLLNDTIQALLPSIYPMLQASFALDFAQLGWITFTFQCTASLFQPLVGLVTDKKPMPHSLATGMGLTLVGLLALAFANSYPLVLVSAALVGLGSAIFHPEASRVAHMAAGNRRGFAQSLFQVGGNAGTALGPLLAALIIVSRGQKYVAWFSLLALLGVIVLWKIGTWQKNNFHRVQKKSAAAHAATALPRKQVIGALAVLVALIFSKYVYLTSMTTYYTFYLIHHFQVSVKTSQLLLFVFLFAVALGTIVGGPVGDRIGRKRVIWASILGVAPFTLLLPHVGLTGTVILTVFIGMILASAFSAILVYAQELVPGKVGMIAGLFFGLAFGIAGIGSAALGHLADRTSIEFVFNLCAFLPLIGLLTVLLPDVEPHRK